MSYRNQYSIENSANRGGWYTCTYCDKGIRFSNADIDHIWPQSKGGSNSTLNLVISCTSCNRSKGAVLDGRVLKGYAVKIWANL